MCSPRHAALAGSGGPDLGHLGGYRAGLDRAGRRGRRGPRAGADLPALYRGAGEDRGPSGLLSHRPGERLAAGSRPHPQLDHLEDPGPGRDRPEQPDRCGVPARCPAGAGRDRRHLQPAAPRRRGLRRRRLRRSAAGDRAAQPGRPGNHVLLVIEGLPRAGLARRLDGGRTHRSAGRGAGGGEEAGGRPAVRDRADGVRDYRGAQRRSQSPGGVPRGAAGALRGHRVAPQRHRRHHRRRPDRGLLCDAAGHPAAGRDRRAVCDQPAARHRRAVRVRVWLWREAGRRLLPHRLPRLAGGARLDLRRHRHVHRGVPGRPPPD